MNLQKKATESFDYDFTGESKFYPFEKPKNIPTDFRIGVIIGASGTGKSTLLKHFGEEETINWDSDRAIVSHFVDPNSAITALSAVGLNSIPSWAKPYHVLSNGEKFRADLSRRIKDNAVVDEFTSVVDRNVAKATSVAISKYIKKNEIKNIVFSSCHADILEWLEPDWVFDANDGTLYDGRSLRRPKINLEIFNIEKDTWGMFKEHHYLDNKMNNASRCYGLLWDGELVGFTASLFMPSGTLKHAWREHRTVILPDYQGMGLGVVLSDGVADIFLKQGLRYYSRSAHPRFGNHRNSGEKWITTSKNKKHRTDLENTIAWKDEKRKYASGTGDTERICFSHEYVGEKYNQREHFKLVIEVNEDEVSYEKFDEYITKMTTNIINNKFLTIISGHARGDTDATYGEKYCFKHGIRQECFPTESKMKRLRKLYSAALIMNGRQEIVEEIINSGLPFKQKNV